MSVSDITVEILKEIRDEMRGLRSGQDETNERLESMGERLDSMGESLAETNQRLGRVEQGVRDLGTFMKHIARDQTKHEKWHVQHIRVIEKDIAELGRARKRTTAKR